MVKKQDEIFSPFPAEGSKIDFRFRKGIWVYAKPNYEQGDEKLSLADLDKFFRIRFWFPFLCWNFGGYHGYIGWKPIPVQHDPKFYWRELDEIQDIIKHENVLFLQLSMRGGTGDIS